jgi:hypothetical protein
VQEVPARVELERAHDPIGQPTEVAADVRDEVGARREQRQAADDPLQGDQPDQPTATRRVGWTTRMRAATRAGRELLPGRDTTTTLHATPGVCLAPWVWSGRPSSVASPDSMPSCVTLHVVDETEEHPEDDDEGNGDDNAKHRADKRSHASQFRHGQPTPLVLTPGRYPVTLRARDKSGLTSPPAHRGFSRG